MAAIVAGMATCGFAQTTTRTLEAFIETAPTGPNTPCTVRLHASPGGVSIAGMSILVGYQEAQGIFMHATNNTGQAGVDPFYTYGDETPYDGVTYIAKPYTDIYVPLIMDTGDDLVLPANVALLHFMTTATYNPSNHFYVDIQAWALAGPRNGGLIGSMASGFERIPVNYVTLSPENTSVQDWNLY